MSIEVSPAPSVAQEVGILSRLRPPVVLATVMGLACLPLLLAHAQTLWEKPHYQFFPWALIGAGVLAWRRREQIWPLVPGWPALSYSLLGLGWLLLAAAGYLVSPWLGMVATLVAFLGFLWLIGGWRLFVALLPSLVLLAILVPPPLRLDERLVLLLQSSTVNIASHTLDWLDLPHVPFAHTLQIPGDQLLVDEACSGIASLLSVVTFSLFFGFYLRRNLFHLALLIPFAVLFVVLGNVARVVIITILKSRYNIDLVNGWKHEMTGLVVFAVCLALTASMDQGILFFTEAVRIFRWQRWTRRQGDKGTRRQGDYQEQTRDSSDPLVSLSPCPLVHRRRAGLLSAAFAVVGLLIVYNVWIYPHALRGDPSMRPLNIASIQQKMEADFLPDKIGHWERHNYERKTRSSGDPVGHYSEVWRYRLGKLEAIVSYDYPFRGNHDLTVCYAAQGWHIVDTNFPTMEESGETSPTTAAVAFERSPIEKSHLWFSLLDERGQWLPADSLHQTTGVSRLVDRFATEALTTVQVQVFVAAPSALDDSNREEARQLFEEVRSRLQNGLFAAGKEQP